MKGIARLPFLIGLTVAVPPGAYAGTLWSNGTVNTTFASDNRCDSGPNLCGNSGSTSWTIFDNFNVPAASKAWVVSGFDFTDFLIDGTNSDYKSTAWSIWNGDPLFGGKLVASGTATAVPTLVSGVCGNGNTCIELFAVTLGSTVNLASGNTYYLGTTNTLTPTNSGETTARAFAAGGNTTPGGTADSLQRWEQSNGSTSGTLGSSWISGSNNFTFPGTLGINEAATAFDINGTLATVPEPGAMTLVGMALGGVCFVRRFRTRSTRPCA
jgi:hypothetical protein